MACTTRLTIAWLTLATAASATAQRTPDEALRALQDGNRRFVAERSLAQPLGEGVRRTLARGESPLAIVLCCTDSRVPPEHVFNTGLGELFVVRVAGHVCDVETLASLEHAVEHLNVPLCVVLGHEQCDVVGAAVARTGAHDHPGPDGGLAASLLEPIEPAVRRALARGLGGKPLGDAAEEEHAQETVQHCLRRSDLLRRYATTGRFRMVAARYHLGSGEVEWLPPRPLPPLASAERAPLPTSVPTGLPPHVALRMLQAGHRRFLGDGLPTGDLSQRRREALTHGQQPLAVVLACADSRTAPEHLFDAGLGELCVIRNAGNTLSDGALASIEQAARTGASLLVVMGHTRCSTVQAAAGNPPTAETTPHLRALLARIEPSVAQARAIAPGGDIAELAVRANVLRTAAEARSRSPLLRQLEAEGRFALLPVVYDVATGDLAWIKDCAPTEEPAAAPAGEVRNPRRQAGGAHERAPGRAPKEPGTPAADHRHAAAGAEVAGPAAPVAPPHGQPARPARGEPAATTTAPTGGSAWWRDLRHVIGLAGIVSMTAAALLLLKRRA
ncbi:MAG: hypothetical protein KF830_14115 [Planctomycetes bacterium]|nr:hypothetical protein [Planctomycetota bacterium]